MQTISVQTILEYKDRGYAEPIKGLHIPNITIPSSLAKVSEARDISSEIRMVFNGLTSQNGNELSLKLVKAVSERAKDANAINSIAQEILDSFLVSEKNVVNCMQMLNVVSNACVLIHDTQKTTDTVGKMFIEKCRKMIFDIINPDNVRKLASYCQDDIDDLDEYTRERERTACIISIICYLYDQRDTTKIKLTASQLIPLLSTICNNYQKCVQKMESLGNPYVEDCEDEDEFLILDDMRCLYIEQLFSFINRSGRVFLKDEIEIGKISLGSIVNRFRDEIVPTITKDYLMNKCGNIRYD